MKELSIKEKAKAYDDLLVKLQKAKEDNDVCDDRYCCVIDAIVPELAESEDERTRKEIVRFIQMEVEDEIVGNKWLAWLEKQGELVNSLSKGLDNAHERIDGLIQKNNFLIEQLKKQGEQKPADKIEQKKDMPNKLTDFKCSLKHIMEEAIECGDTHNLNADADMLLRLIQNSAWSEEDKRKMDRIYSILRQAADTHAFSTTCRLIGDAECIELQDFLKHLKDRVGCEANCTTMWKPSCEQIKVCKKVYADILSAKGFDLGTVNSELNRLEEELKELKE